jgi:hypothetical protein
MVPAWEPQMEADSLVSSYFARFDQELATLPTVSVVITSNEPEDVLESRVASARTRFDPSRTQYVVAWAASGRAGVDLKRRFPYVHLITAPASTPAADLLIQGVNAAAGDILLLLHRESPLDAEFSDQSTVGSSGDVLERRNSA